MHAWYPEAIEPLQWNVVFHRKAKSWWSSSIAMGHFKHVSAFAYLQGLRGWVLFDVQFSKLRIVVLPDNQESQAILSQVMSGNAVVEMVRREGGGVRFFRVGFFCTIAIKHLLGLPGGALRPDRLYRDCLAHGGQLIHDTRSATPDSA
jgi:hypothetical protein